MSLKYIATHYATGQVHTAGWYLPIQSDSVWSSLFRRSFFHQKGHANAKRPVGCLTQYNKKGNIIYEAWFPLQASDTARETKYERIEKITVSYIPAQQRSHALRAKNHPWKHLRNCEYTAYRYGICISKGIKNGRRRVGTWLELDAQDRFIYVDYENGVAKHKQLALTPQMK